MKVDYPFKYGKTTISYTGAKLWNILNNETKQAINIKTFSRFNMLHVLDLTVNISH